MLARPCAAAVSISSFSCASSSFSGAGTDACTVAISGNVKWRRGWTVNLTGSNPAVTVPSTLDFPRGTTRVSFTADIAAVSVAQSATITASASNGAVRFTIQLKPVAAAPVLSGLACSSRSLTGAASDACVVSLSAAAPGGGFAVVLASNNSAVRVPGSVTVPAGATSEPFTATVSAVSTTQTATVTATAAGVSEATSLQLNAASPAWTVASTSVSFGSVTVNSTATQSISIQSTGTAPLTISSGAVSGAAFRISGLAFPVTLNPGQMETLNIAFDPTAASSYTGAVTLVSNAATGGTVTIALSGSGEAASYEVDLSWNAPTDSSDPVSGYDVYRAVSGSSSSQLLNPSVEGGTTYTDTTVRSGTSYTYYVVSVDASGNQSAPSNLFNVTIP